MFANKTTCLHHNCERAVQHARPEACFVWSAGAEQAVACIAKSGKDVAGRVQFAIDRCRDDGYVGVRSAEAADSFGRGDEAKERDARRADLFEARNRGDRAATGGEHRIEQEELTLGCIGRNLEVVVDRLQCGVIPIEPDVPDARRREQAKDAFDHSETGPEDGHQNGLLARKACPRGALERRIDRVRFERESGRGFVRHEHGDLVHEFLEDLRWRAAIPKQREFMLHEGMAYDKQAGDFRGGWHAGESSIFARMKEYQAVIVRLGRRVREDEDAITDLLNERSRGGWEPELITQDAERVTIVFSRRAEAGR